MLTPPGSSYLSHWVPLDSLSPTICCPHQISPLSTPMVHRARRIHHDQSPPPRRPRQRPYSSQRTCHLVRRQSRLGRQLHVGYVLPPNMDRTLIRRGEMAGQSVGQCPRTPVVSHTQFSHTTRSPIPDAFQPSPQQFPFPHCTLDIPIQVC